MKKNTNKSNKANSASNPAATQIAIIGLGCWYPGARNARQLWENILGRRAQFRRMPDVRLPISEYHDADRSVPDKTYGTRAAVIDGYAFDWAKKRIPKQTYEATDLVHWLALDVALQMLEDAGYDGSDLPRETTQVVVGNTLTGEFTRSNTLRGRWPFVNKILSASAANLHLEPATITALSQNMERSFKSVFAPTNEDTLAGGLANTIAGRICNYLNLQGGGFTVDGACSSSLIAVHTAASNLVSGATDFAIAGGVDISLDPFELVGFAKTGALTPNEMSVYDKRGNGFIPGEGCGFVGMKRLADAQRDGDKIYAVLDGWGMSSDGKGGITAPTVNGQSLALKRAYQQAGITPRDLDFIEGHGTGTAVGDKTELLAIARALDGAGNRQCGVTSFKSIVGHTKAAAGIGALIKAVLAVNQRVIPPTAGCSAPHDVFSKEATGLYPVLRGAVLPADKQLRAGVSAMGFGGINLHVTLRSGDDVVTGLRPGIGERAALASRQDSEVYCFTAGSFDKLAESVRQLQADAFGASVAELADLAAAHNRTTDPQARVRASLIARSPEELIRKAGVLLDMIRTAPAPGAVQSDRDNMIALSHAAAPVRIGYMFPGQGSQRLNMARTLVERFDWADTLVKQADKWAAEMGTPNLAQTIYADLDRHLTKDETEPLHDGLKDTQIAQPAIALASLLWLKYLDRLGLSADAVIGHSLGELTAFHAAGAFGERVLIELATLRGKLMASTDGRRTGAMVSLACGATQAESLIGQVKDSGILVIANINSPSQTVVSGDSAAAEKLYELAAREGVVTHRLPVSNAFHSPLVQEAANQLFTRAPMSATANPLQRTLISSCDGQLVGEGIDLRAHFASQITRQVDFVASRRTLLQHCDLALEVGPGHVLSNLISQSDDDSSLPCYPIERQAESFNDLNWMVALAHVHGRVLNWDALYENRIIRQFIPAKELEFVVNPCERPFESVHPARVGGLHPSGAPAGAGGTTATSELARYLGAQTGAGGIDMARYFAERGGFIAEVIRADWHSRAFPAAGVAHKQAVAAPTTPARLSAPSVAGPQVALDAEQEIRAIVAAITGFDSDSISMSLHIADDLNLDSLKSAELIARIAARFGTTGDVDSTLQTAQTLADLLPLVRLAVPAPAATQVDAREVVLKLAARATGFAPEQISLGMNLLDDLNLDSIKAGALIADACAQLGVAGQLDPAALSGLSLGQLAEALNALRGEAVQNHAVAPASALDVLLDLAADYTGFTRESLKPSSSFVDDLNLDSIKFAALVSDAASRLGLEGKINPSEVANTKIEDLAAQMEALMPGARGPKPTVAKESEELGNDWVRSFTIDTVPAPLAASPIGANLAGQVIAIQADAPDDEMAANLRTQLTAQGATVLLFDAERLQQQERRDIAHCIVFLPRSAAASSDQLGAAVKRLRAAAVVSARQEACVSLTYVQFGGISAGAPRAGVDLHMAGAASFAASVHLERPHLKVRVLDFHPQLAADFVTRQIMNEAVQPDSYLLGRYDEAQQRYRSEPRVAAPGLWAPRPLTWEPSDVVIVTGGARGITAECAFAFANTTRARMVLVGSSAYNDDMRTPGEIATTLARFADAGLVAHYHQCDIVDANAVTALVREVEDRYGNVTGIVHGAGINKPRRVEQCSEEDAIKEVSPKVKGIMHLLAALEGTPLKLIAGLSSIIGVTGMPGNAWYAFSNEALNLCLDNYQHAHPATHVVSLAYSVWGEVGMGAKMGSTKQLAKMGISAIPVDGGVTHFLHSVLNQSERNLVVIASRLGGLDTWRTPRATQDTGLRFIREIVAFEPGVELVSRVRLTLQDDLYLRDHYYRGVYLFPTVFGLEAMAQSVATVLGLEGFDSLRIENIQLPRPIIVTGDAGTVVQIHAQVIERNDPSEPVSVAVGVRTEHTGFRRDHFAAVFVLDSQTVAPAADDIVLPDVPTDISPLTDLYGGLLFQGPLFQRLRRVWAMDWDGAITEIERRAGADYFAANQPARLLLGDPAFRDVLLQSAQLSEKGVYLPVHIDALHLYSLHTEATDLAVAQSKIAPRINDEDRVCSVVAVSSQGAPIERLVGYRLKRVDYDEQAAVPEDYVNPRARDADLLRKALRVACGKLNVVAPEHLLMFYPTLSQMDKSRRRLSELPLLSEVILKALGDERTVALDQLEVQWQADGKPVLLGLAQQDVNVSLSHDDAHCLCVAGEGAQGCDIEPVAARSEEGWAGLLGSKRRALVRELVAAGDTLDEAGTRIWCAIECVKKALGGPSVDLEVVSFDGPSAVLRATREHGSTLVLTAALSLTRRSRKIVAMVVRPLTAAAPAIAATPALTPAALDPLVFSHMGTGPQGQVRPCFRFRVTFKDTTTLRNSVEFPTFANWMGNIRELGIMKTADQLVADFSSGRWGMVTNHSDIVMLADAHCLDIIEGRMHISRAYGKFNSSVDMHFEWARVNEDGSTECIALSNMATTWVEITGHGTVEVRPFPAYLEEFITSALPAIGSGPSDPAPRAIQMVPDPATSGLFGACLYQAPNAPKIEPELFRERFSTTSAESNLVGNVYYSNYYHWQKKVIDMFFHRAWPKELAPGDRAGEFHCVRSEIRHLREAMPFDKIEVVMALKASYRRGIRLHFDFYKMDDHGEPVKLAFGEYEAVWSASGDKTQPSDIPERYMSALLQGLTA